jgi:hypothetical protein
MCTWYQNLKFPFLNLIIFLINPNPLSWDSTNLWRWEALSGGSCLFSFFPHNSIKRTTLEIWIKSLKTIYVLWPRILFIFWDSLALQPRLALNLWSSHLSTSLPEVVELQACTTAWTRNSFPKKIIPSRVWWLKPIILGTQRWRSGGFGFQASTGKKFVRPHLNQWLGIVACACHPNYAGKHK